MVTASPLAMPERDQALGGRDHALVESPVVTFCQRPGPIFLAAITVSAPVPGKAIGK